MTVYFMAFIHEVHSLEKLGEYAQTAPATVDQAGGTRLAAGLRETETAPRGSNRVAGAETIEGKPVAGVSLLSFPDRKSFEAWYYSDAYQKVLKTRQAAVDTQVVIIESP